MSFNELSFSSLLQRWKELKMLTNGTLPVMGLLTWLDILKTCSKEKVLELEDVITWSHQNSQIHMKSLIPMKGCTWLNGNFILFRLLRIDKTRIQSMDDNIIYPNKSISNFIEIHSNKSLK